MISFENIQIKFNDQIVIPDFTLEIEAGEFFTLLGPSGCGKTTALRSLAGFVDPSKGQIKIAGKDVTKLPSDKREIGMVFQNYALFPSMSVYDNIAFGLKVKKVKSKEIESQVHEIAEQVDLKPQQLEKNVAALSGGQQQRVAIARALIMRPKILLLDEPLSNLDAKLRGQLRIQLKDLQSRFGITTVYVTHDQDEALAMSDRIAVMNEGKIEQVGPPEEIYTNSATEFVCNFIGDVNKFYLDDVRQNSTEFGMNPQLPIYARVEKVRISRAIKSINDEIKLDGIIVQQRYHGLHTSYTVKVGNSFLKAIVPETGAHEQFEINEEVSLFIHPKYLLQYADTLNRS